MPNEKHHQWECSFHYSECKNIKISVWEAKKELSQDLQAEGLLHHPDLRPLTLCVCVCLTSEICPSIHHIPVVSPLAWEPIASLLRVIFPMTSSWLQKKIKENQRWCLCYQECMDLDWTWSRKSERTSGHDKEEINNLWSFNVGSHQPHRGCLFFQKHSLSI